HAGLVPAAGVVVAPVTPTISRGASPSRPQRLQRTLSKSNPQRRRDTELFGFSRMEFLCVSVPLWFALLCVLEPLRGLSHRPHHRDSARSLETAEASEDAEQKQTTEAPRHRAIRVSERTGIPLRLGASVVCSSLCPRAPPRSLSSTAPSRQRPFMVVSAFRRNFAAARIPPEGGTYRRKSGSACSTRVRG